jgi:hypothetical protein
MRIHAFLDHYTLYVNRRKPKTKRVANQPTHRLRTAKLARKRVTRATRAEPSVRRRRVRPRSQARVARRLTVVPRRIMATTTVGTMTRRMTTAAAAKNPPKHRSQRVMMIRRMVVTTKPP